VRESGFQKGEHLERWEKKKSAAKFQGKPENSSQNTPKKDPREDAGKVG